MSTGSHSVSQSSDASPPCSAEQTSPLHHLLNMCFIFFILFHLFIYLLFLLHSLLFYIHHVLYYVTHIKPFQASLTVPLVLWILKALFLFFYSIVVVIRHAFMKPCSPPEVYFCLLFPHFYCAIDASVVWSLETVYSFTAFTLSLSSRWLHS